MAPGVVHASASLRTRRLYSAVNARRSGFAATCTSSTVTGISTRASIGSKHRDRFRGAGVDTRPPVRGMARRIHGVAGRAADVNRHPVGQLIVSPLPFPSPVPAPRHGRRPTIPDRTP